MPCEPRQCSCWSICAVRPASSMRKSCSAIQLSDAIKRKSMRYAYARPFAAPALMLLRPFWILRVRPSGMRESARDSSSSLRAFGLSSAVLMIIVFLLNTQSASQSRSLVICSRNSHGQSVGPSSECRLHSSLANRIARQFAETTSLSASVIAEA